MGDKECLSTGKPHVLYRAFFYINCISINLFASVWVLEGVDILDQRILLLVLYVSSLVILAPCIGNRFPMKTLTQIIFICLLAAMYLLFNMVFLFEPTVKIFIPLVLFVLMGHALCQRNLLVSYLRVFVNVTVVLAVISLVFYVFGSCLKAIAPTSYYVYDWSWISKVPSYFDVYFEARPASASFPLAKNCGIYPEPAMFVFSLGIALAIQTLFLKDSSIKEALLLIATVSTFSSTAYIFLLVLYGYRVLKLMAAKNRLSALVMLLAPIVFIVLLYLIFTVIEDKSTTGSYSIRVDHMFSCLRAFLENPLGVGMVNSNRLNEYFTFEGGASVGILYLLATGGIECGLMLFIPMTQAFVRAVRSRDFDAIMFILLFFILFFMTNVLVRIRPWFVVGAILLPYAVGGRFARGPGIAADGPHA